MKNYNDDFFRWLEKIRKINPKSEADVPEELQTEFEKLMFLADIPFRHIYGEDPEALSEFLMICLSERDYYADDGRPLTILMVEEGRTYTSPVTHRVAQPVLSARDTLGRYFIFFYCDWRGPEVGTTAAVYDAIQAPFLEQGKSIEERPDVYFIFLTDYDLGHTGRQVLRSEEATLQAETEESDPESAKIHFIFFNAAIVSSPQK